MKIHWQIDREPISLILDIYISQKARKKLVIELNSSLKMIILRITDFQRPPTHLDINLILYKHLSIKIVSKLSRL